MLVSDLITLLSDVAPSMEVMLVLPPNSDPVTRLESLVSAGPSVLGAYVPEVADMKQYFVITPTQTIVGE